MKESTKEQIIGICFEIVVGLLALSMLTIVPYLFGRMMLLGAQLPLIGCILSWIIGASVILLCIGGALIMLKAYEQAERKEKENAFEKQAEAGDDE